ncbi:MAG: C4-dicarboxylate ABC transporter [Gammaproteobacteria bacterium]|nr:MAG: C4-dicarboxylate ABC transporter [Gammaproteobacteria bacterium]
MEEAHNSKLKNFPVSWFAVVMGLSGLAIAWHRSEQVLELAVRPSGLLLGLALATFFTLLFFYVMKSIKHFAAVKAEFAHPVKLNFFPAISISLILLSIALLPHHQVASMVFWSIGALLHLGFTLYVLSAWLHQTHFELAHINPAWFIPIVGNVLVPIAGVKHASPEVSWFFFSIGLVFWLVLLTLVFYRMFFHQPLPEKLLPTLFILIAPPAVGFISWMQLTGDLNAFARVLYYVALFLTIMLLTQIGRFIKLKFFLSWWAYSFPSAAVTIATLLMYQHLQLSFFKYLGSVFLLLLTLLITGLLVRTLKAVFNQEICIED